jgi:hypothetical protein
VQLRARYYNPTLGQFPNLDPLETPNRYQYVGANPINGAVGELGWRNPYAYVAGNPVNLVDPSGMIGEMPHQWDKCSSQQPTECQLKCGNDMAVVNMFDMDDCIRRCEAELKGNPQSRCNTLANYAQQLANSSRYNGRQVLSMLIRYAVANYVYQNAKALSDDISCAITGSRGPNTIFDASGFGRKFGYPKAPAALGAGGWNKDYDDGTNNQAFHVWSYVNTVAQGGDLGILLSAAANIGHECWDITDAERSTPDYNLAWAGIILGYAIYNGNEAPSDIAGWIDTWLGGSKSFEDLMNSQNAAQIAKYTTGGKPILCPLIDRGGKIKIF